MEESGVIGVSDMPKARVAVMAKRGCVLNVMVVGSHGVGKTTFLGQMFGITELNKCPFPPHGGNNFWYNEGVCNIQTSIIEVVEGDFTVQLKITEVDNIGDNVNNNECYAPIVDILQENFRSYEEQFNGAIRDAIDDARIHVCFYMLEPFEQLKMADIETMKAISRFCSIVPLIGKSDLLSGKKIGAMRAMIRDQLDSNNISVFDNKHGGFEAPFFVILGEVDKNQLSRERCYPWGVVELDKLAQNEFYKVREFILQRSIVNLRNETEFYYDNYRTSKLAAYLVEIGKSSENKTLMMKLEEHRKEVREMKERIKQKRNVAFEKATNKR
ncbi:cell division control protein 12 [Pancytospora epiphaga]|nr:cell division control protein 12 [Pancytospora epiphaga]